MRWALVIAALVLACEEADDTATTATSGSPTGGLGGAGAGDCGRFCDAMIALGCEDATCAPGCVQAQAMAGDCKQELGAYVSCLAEQSEVIESCFEYPPACEDTHTTWIGCGADDGCGVVECKDVGVDACQCQAVCTGALYAEKCAKGADGWDCTCSQDGTEIETCTGLINGCAFFVGCCGPHVSG